MGGKTTDVPAEKKRVVMVATKKKTDAYLEQNLP